MQELPPDVAASFGRQLAQAKVPESQRPEYHKWAKLYLYFCEKFGFPATAPTALGPFLTKLAAKNYSIDERHHAAKAVKLLVRHDPQAPNVYLQLSAPSPQAQPPSRTKPPRTAGSVPACPSPGTAQAPAGKPEGLKPASWEREYHDLEAAIKLRNYSGRTLEAYRFWVARFQAFVRSRPTAQLSNQEVRGFLSSLG